jgi:hypothetical protein
MHPNASTGDNLFVVDIVFPIRADAEGRSLHSVADLGGRPQVRTNGGVSERSLRDPLILFRNIAELPSSYLQLIDDSEKTTHSCGLHVGG